MILDGISLTIDQLVRTTRGRENVSLSKEAQKRIQRSREYVDGKLLSNDVIYGVNTGFGIFSDVKIPLERSRALQLNVIRSHAAGVGEELERDVVRAMMILRINTLARGHSGVRLRTVETLCDMLNKDILPVVPSKGSVGASGDLVPLAHVVLGLIGEGEVMYGGKRQAALTAFKKVNLQPVSLEAKEGLALINGTQLMTALGALVVHDAHNIAEHADIAAALSTDVLMGSINHTDPIIHAARPFDGQRISAMHIRRLMEGSPMLASHAGCSKVQDAYSLRCAPQVHGASRDAISYVHGVIETEMNSSTDNPLVFPEEGKIISGGNFHGEPIALAVDFLGIALSEFAGISERRIARLTDHKLSECLPTCLTPDGGLHSGMMAAHYTAAALVSENKVLAHPSSVDSIPTCAQTEDHVSMGATGALHCRDICENTKTVLGIELLCAAQALDLHRPMRSSGVLETIHAHIRAAVPKLDDDRILHNDIIRILKVIEDANLIRIAYETHAHHRPARSAV